MTAWVLCEESGIWSQALWEHGYEVVQVDLAERNMVKLGHCRQVAPGWSYLRADVRTLVPGREPWGRPNVVCAFPPCTDLAGVGARLWPAKAGRGQVLDSLSLLTHCAALAAWAGVAGLVENPSGLAARVLGEPSMRCNPWEFADEVSDLCLKRTLLWLYDWPLVLRFTGSERKPISFIEGVAPGDDQARIRSLAWSGMARAFVSSLPKGGNQWQR